MREGGEGCKALRDLITYLRAGVGGWLFKYANLIDLILMRERDKLLTSCNISDTSNYMDCTQLSVR